MGGRCDTQQRDDFILSRSKHQLRSTSDLLQIYIMFKGFPLNLVIITTRVAAPYCYVDMRQKQLTRTTGIHSPKRPTILIHRRV